MISVIIPLYNREKEIAFCLDSLLDQTINDFEVCLVNDGSLDNSLDVANSYLTKFKKKDISYKIISQDNHGAPAARNRGYTESNGDYLFFCDADSVLEPNALEELLFILKNNSDKSYSYSSFLWGKKLFKVGEFSAEKLKQGPMIHTMSLIKKTAFPPSGWDENIKKFQDWDLYLTMLENNHTGIWVNKTLYKINPGGTMSNWLPAIAYKFMPFLKAVKKYNQALKIIKEKHNLD